MSFEKNRYANYYNRICAIDDGTTLAEDVIDSLFDELLCVLPNGGKLYRYRVPNEYCIDELDTKSIWFSSASRLNDNKDCIYYMNYCREMEDLVTFLMTNDNYRKSLAKSLYNDLRKEMPSLTVKDIDDGLSMTTNNGKLLRKYDFDKYCSRFGVPSKEKKLLYDAFKEYCRNNKNEEAIRQFVGKIFGRMEDIRNNTHIRSFTTSYRKDSMWAYYCDNHGICIEYDFSKIDTVELKKVFVYTFKVKYGKRREFSFVEVAKANLSDNRESRSRVNNMTIQQLLTKDRSWSTEEEWRTVTYLKDNKEGHEVFADIVSSIYIDYSIVNKIETERLIALAKKNGWVIYIRYFNRADACYYYDTIENINRLVNEYKKSGLDFD